ncbi:MAG: hypothetical protein J07HQW1_01373 [Haloquadratum walsbyi J07HQW1]|uniref:Uncharacterized protein n=1 Tax=Haloquadratum walsbyi J07HQW1 TaxID=1238424 RepID=U1MNC9_9EURY|nr:MAG: hypothetical protein J07HQW1_01373 [Haloquadratum walsbyi J07HQW1]
MPGSAAGAPAGRCIRLPRRGRPGSARTPHDVVGVAHQELELRREELADVQDLVH